jgi:hypothetical protein
VTVPAVPAYSPIASAASMQSGSLKYITRDVTDGELAQVMVRASRTVEARCQRRFSPFYGLVESQVAEGVGSDGSGSRWGFGASALGFVGNLGMYADRGDDQVREFWVNETAVHRPELWQYTAFSVAIIRPFSAPLVLASQVIGPQTDTGHVRFPNGTFCPPGSTIVCTYSGGYTLGYPEDLMQAVKLTAAKSLILEIEPQSRPGMDTGDLDLEITDLLATYAR